MKAHKLSHLFKKKACDVSNIKDLRRQYAFHKNEAKKIKKILRELAYKIQESSDSESDDSDPRTNTI